MPATSPPPAKSPPPKKQLRFPKPRDPYQRLLLAELLLALAVIGLRAIADYVPQGEGIEPGAEKPPRGAPPLLMLSATMIVYFLLTFVVIRGGTIAKIGVLAALVMDISLLQNSQDEIGTVARWFENMSPPIPGTPEL